MFVIGLTGGVGTGKSLVSEMLEGLGAAVVNADLLGHETYRPHTETWQRIVETFGNDVLTPTGEVDRQKLGAIVFSGAEPLQRLNTITRPRIYEMIKERIARLSGQGAEVVVVEAALLVEANWTPLVDEVWVTTSTEDQVIQRLRRRNNLNKEAVRARVRAQMPQEERVKSADVMIDNSGSLAELKGNIQKLWNGRVLAHQENRRQR